MICERRAITQTDIASLRDYDCTSVAHYYLSGFLLCEECARQVVTVRPDLEAYLYVWTYIAPYRSEGLAFVFPALAPKDQNGAIMDEIYRQRFYDYQQWVNAQPDPPDLD